MAPSGNTPQNEALEIDELQLDSELFRRAETKALEKESKLKQKAALVAKGFSLDNPEFKMLEMELSVVNRELDQIAQEWAEKRVSSSAKNRSDKIDKKKERFFNRLEHRIKVERQEAAMESEPNEKKKANVDVQGKASNEGASEDAQTQAENLNEVTSKVTVSPREARSLAVKRMLDLENPLSPLDLTEGDRQMEAIGVVFADQPKLRAQLRDNIAAGPDSPSYKAAMGVLIAKQRELEPVYDYMSEANKAQEDLETATIQGTLLNKLQHVGSEFVRNPAAMAAAAATVVGLYLFWQNASHDGKEDWKDSLKSVIKYSLVGFGGIATADFIWDKLDPKHRGLWDTLGANPNNVVASDVLEKYRSHFEGIPTKDKDSMDDMIRILDVDMETVNSVYEKSLGKDSVETEHLIGRGIDDSTESAIDGGSLKTGLDWFYTQCAEKHLKESRATRPSSDAELQKMGLNWAKRNLKGHDFLSANYVVNIQDKLPAAESSSTASSPSGSSESSRAPEVLMIQDRHLRELTEIRAFGESVVQLASGAVLVGGYPFKYNYRENGAHVFGDALNPDTTPLILSSDETGDTKMRTLSAMVEEGKTRARAAIVALDSTVLKSEQLRLQAGGGWKLDPPLARKKAAGLGTYKENENVPFTAHSDESGFSLRLDTAPGERFTKIEDLQKRFELDAILTPKIQEDLSHVLKDVPNFKVVDFSNPTTSSTLAHFTYGSGHKGTVTYENGSVTRYTLEADSELQSRWEAAARADVDQFFSDGDLQDAIVAIIGVPLDTNSNRSEIEINGDLLGMAGKTFSDALAWITDDDIEARFKDEREKQIVKDLKEQEKIMRDGYVNDLYSQNLTKEAFTAKKRALDATYRARIDGILGTTTDMILKDEEVREMKTEATKRINKAFDPADKNWFVNNPEFTTRLSELQSKTAAEIDALGPNPKRSQVEAVIARNERAASIEANAHIGTSEADTMRMLSEKRLDGHYANDWRGSREQVYSYITGAFAFEQYIALDKRKNAQTLMDIFDQKINYGNYAPNPRHKPQEYAEYFMHSAWLILGGEGDYSPRQLYAKLNVVSDTDFQQKLSALQNIKDYPDYLRSPDPRPSVPERLDQEELMRQKVRAAFEKWFDDKIQISNSMNLIGPDWESVFKTHTMQRLDLIVNDRSLSPLDLSNSVKRLGEFIVVEKSLYQICKDGNFDGRTKPTEMQAIIDPIFQTEWNNPASGALSYAAALKGDFDFFVLTPDLRTDAVLLKALDTVLQTLFGVSIPAGWPGSGGLLGSDRDATAR